MQFRLNFGSFFTGILCVLCVGMLISSQYPQDDSSNGRYEAKTNDNGFIILDTQTGQYILESDVNYIGKYRLIRGDFKTNFEAGRDLFSKK